MWLDNSLTDGPLRLCTGDCWKAVERWFYVIKRMAKTKWYLLNTEMIVNEKGRGLHSAVDAEMLEEKNEMVNLLKVDKSYN